MQSVIINIKHVVMYWFPNSYLGYSYNRIPNDPLQDYLSDSGLANFLKWRPVPKLPASIVFRLDIIFLWDNVNPVHAALWSHKRQKAKLFFEYFWLGTTLRPKGSRNLFIIHYWLWMEECQILMIFPFFFIKMQKKSGSRLGSKIQHKIFWRVFSSCVP